VHQLDTSAREKWVGVNEKHIGPLAHEVLKAASISPEDWILRIGISHLI
jgi:hypothetical protein